MEITQIVGIGIIGIFAAVTVKEQHPAIGICVSLAAGVMILTGIAPKLFCIIDALSEICGKNETIGRYFSLILRVTGVAYLTQLASSLAKDAGEEAISKKLELAGKVCALALTMPALENLMELITEALAGF